MARYSFGNRGGKVRRRVETGAGQPAKSPEEVVREAREAKAKAGEDYRERSLAIHGLVCARCGREFSGKDRRLLRMALGPGEAGRVEGRDDGRGSSGFGSTPPRGRSPAGVNPSRAPVPNGPETARAA